MEKVRTWLNPTKNKIIAGAVATLLISVMGLGVWSLTKQGNDSPKDVMFTDIEIIMVEGKQKMNADADLLVKNLIGKHHPNLENASIKSFNYNSSKVSNVKDVYGKITDKNELSKEIIKRVLSKEVVPFLGTATYIDNSLEKTIQFEYIVIDTNFPVFTKSDDIKTSLNEIPDYKALILAEDSVDGRLEVNVSGDARYDVPGDYTMTAVATDKNGNKTVKEIKLTVNESSKDDESEVINLPTESDIDSNEGSGTSSTTNNGTDNDVSNAHDNSTSEGSSDTPEPPTVETPSEPSYVCATGRDKDLPCDSWIDPNGYAAYTHFGSMSSCQIEGKIIYDSLKMDLIDGKDITNYACQELSVNDASYGSFYRLELMHNGQWWLNSNHQWVQ